MGKVIFDKSKVLNFGMQNSPRSHTDICYGAVAPITDLPSYYECPIQLKIKNQGKEGKCTGFAGAYKKEIQEGFNHKGKNFVFSPEFLYQLNKRYDGLEEGTEGSTILASQKTQQKHGVCLESVLPYQSIKSYKDISEAIYKQAEQFKIKNYARIYTINEMKDAILKHGGVESGVLVTDSFVHSENGWIDRPNGYYRGGHAILLKDWDDTIVHTFKSGRTTKGAFKFPNSWDTDWGDNGYGYIPYEVMMYKLADFNIPFLMEAFSSVDIVTPTIPSIPLDNKISLWIDKKEAIVNGKKVLLDVAPTIDKSAGRTLVPIRFISESLGFKVKWINSDKRIEIKK